MKQFRSTFRVFYNQELRSFLQANSQKIIDKINQEAENYMLTVNEAEYIDFLVEEFAIENLNLEFESESIESYEKHISAELFPPFYYVNQGQTYSREAIVYYIPFTGDSGLLGCAPSNLILRSYEVFVEDNCLCFEIVSFSNDAAEIKREHDQIVNDLSHQLSNLQQEVEHYKKGLREQITNVFAARKKKILEKHNMLAALNVPLRRRDNLAQTYMIPDPAMRKKISIEKPVVKDRNYEPEPTLKQTTYFEILKTLQDAGKGLERQPSTYQGLHEEELRNLFLFFLQPQFEGSATGETFNKTGKTDILLRYENSNVFIAECKFWSGAKKYLETITQLLS